MKKLFNKLVIRVTLFFLCLAVLSLFGDTDNPESLGYPTAAASFPSSQQPSGNSTIPQAKLDELADIVRGYFDKKLIVGAELMVIKDENVILHETVGWKDMEDSLVMEKNTIFNIRSMTKPLVGAAAQILVDEGKIAPDDPVAEYIPGFDNSESQNITIRQLLTHRSGLPLSILQSVDDYPDLISIANAAGENGPQFEPGSRFWYSDTGLDVLGAIVQMVSGQLLDEYITAKILQPLGMDDTFVPVDSTDSRWNRIASLYVGTAGSWGKFWQPNGGQFYPFAWGSQTMYSTPADYSRFMTLFMNDGEFVGQQILSQEAVQRMLIPFSVMTSLGSDMLAPTGFPDLRAYYGETMVVYLDENAGLDSNPILFGHSGSDGTFVWAWPEQNLMVLYFTQSRGGLSGIRLETELYRLFINPERDLDDEIPEGFTDYFGTYVANFGPFRNEEFSIKYRYGSLLLDIPSQLEFELKEPGEDGKWYFEMSDNMAVQFDRNQSGNVKALRLFQGGQEFLLPRGTAPDEPRFDVTVYAGYTGTYTDTLSGEDIIVLVRNENLALENSAGMTFELYPPDSTGWWILRLNPALRMRFNEDETGRVISMTRNAMGDELDLLRVER